MCLIYQLYEPIVGSSGKKYSSIDSLKQAEDIFGKDLMLVNNTWDKFKTDAATTTFENQIDGDFCLCYLETEKLLEMRGLKHFIDFKLTWEDWNGIEY